MRILLIAQYFAPESVGTAIQIHQLAVDLVAKGHRVAMLTAFPNYPQRIVFDGYRRQVFKRERIDGVDVIRTWIFASPNEAIWSRLLNFGSFCASAAIGGLAAARPDVIYCIIPPLPLGASAQFLGLVKRAPVVVNIQDIYPDIAIALGFLRHRPIIRFFRWMERFVYHHAAGVVVISGGFRENLLDKGVPTEKVHVVPNWADPDFFRPGLRGNPFRAELGVGERFTVIYSGNLSHNSNVEPVIGAAEILQDEPFTFVIVGDGVRKGALVRKAEEKQLQNVQFLSFQPWETYPQVLAAADISLVTLNTQAAMASVPSKVFKIMASGRPVLAITTDGNEVHRLVTESICGLCVPPDDPAGLAEVLRHARAHPDELARMGANARRYLEEHFVRSKCVAQIEDILAKARES